MYKTVTPIALSFLSLIIPVVSTAQSFHLKTLETNVVSSFRGMSIVNDQMAWVSGSKGYVGHTHNGGKSWRFSQINGFEELSFRSIYAFSEQKVIVANAGSPASILLTNDHGVTWDTVYTNTHKDAFFDGIDFWNENEGLIYGDAIDGKMLLLSTIDGGNTWTQVSTSPRLETDEASFAASGTGIRCLDGGKAIIATGGMKSRLFLSENKGATWTDINLPILQNGKATGIFSLATHNATIVVVGGDYNKPNLSEKHNLVSYDNGATWLTPESPTRGYRECVEYIEKDTWIATGPTGTDISYDNGKNWTALFDDEGFHVVRKARDGSLLLMAGSKGQIGIIER